MILRRLACGDPLGIRHIALGRLRRDAFFLDEERVVARAMARVAFASMSYDGRPPLDRWLGARCYRAIDELVSEQRDEELRGGSTERSQDRSYYETLSDMIGLPPGRARLVCCTLNGLPVDARRAFRAVVLEGRTVDDYATERHERRDRVVSVLNDAATHVLSALAVRARDRHPVEGSHSVRRRIVTLAKSSVSRSIDSAQPSASP